jgi:MFS superfamily sulfate permease-like transporter
MFCFVLPSSWKDAAEVDDALNWDANWAWSVPLIVLTVILHVIGLGIINERAVQVETAIKDHRHFLIIFALVMGFTTLFATILHAIEASIWAAAFRLLGALPDARTAMLYSLGAMTTYGHANIYLEPHWRLMGVLEALNGMILFGLTTAFMFAIIQRVWPAGSQEWRARVHWPKRTSPAAKIRRQAAAVNSPLSAQAPSQALDPGSDFSPGE